MQTSRTRFGKPLLACALALAGLGLASQAQATVVSYASIQMFDFKFGKTAGTVIGNPMRSSSSTATLDGNDPSYSDGPHPGFTDVQEAFVGSGNDPGQNVYSPHATTSNAAALTLTGNAARADAVTGEAVVPIPSLPGRTGIYIQNVAEGRMNVTGTANANSSNNTSRIVSFASNSDDFSISFDALIRRYVNAAASGDFGQANTTLTFSMSKAGGTKVHFKAYDANGAEMDTTSWTDQCSQESGLGSCDALLDYDSAGLVAGGAVTLRPDWGHVANRAGDWTLTLNNTSSVQLSDPARIPEPATLSLLGAGLLGLAGVRRRQTRASQTQA